MLTEDPQVLLEPVDFTKIRQKGRNHRRTQSNTAYDLCGILPTHHSQPELIKEIAENYKILDGGNTQRILEATHQIKDEKQIIVEDIFEIPRSTAIVPHRSKAHNPLNFVKKRNLSCGASSDRIGRPDLRANYHDLNDIIGLNIIVERKNSVESSEYDNTAHEVRSERKSHFSKEERIHTRSSSVTVMDLRSSLDAAATQELKHIVQEDKAESLQETDRRQQDSHRSRRQQATPCITADISTLIQQKDGQVNAAKTKVTPQKNESKQQQQLRAPCPSQKKTPQETQHQMQGNQKNGKTEPILFTFDQWTRPVNYVRDRSASKSATPTNLTMNPGTAYAGQTPIAALNKSATANGSSSLKVLNNTPFNLPKATTSSSAKNFLVMLGKKKHQAADQLRGIITAPVSNLSQERRPQRSFLGFERQPSSNDKTPILSKKSFRDETPSRIEPNGTLETKVLSLEGKIDTLLLKNSSLEEQNGLLVKLVEKLSNQYSELLKTNQEMNLRLTNLEDSRRNANAIPRIRDMASRTAKENVPEFYMRRDYSNLNLLNTTGSTNPESLYAEIVHTDLQKTKKSYQETTPFTVRDMNTPSTQSNRSIQENFKTFDHFTQECKNNLMQKSSNKKTQRKSQSKHI